jgi:hypothetical protein
MPKTRLLETESAIRIFGVRKLPQVKVANCDKCFTEDKSGDDHNR